jgi:hypothetical protein
VRSPDATFGASDRGQRTIIAPAMFPARWSWSIPLVAALAVFAGVLLTTPPGLAAIPEVLLATVRGPTADAALYALGAASSLSLVVLLILAAVCGPVDFLLRSQSARSHRSDKSE